MNKVVAVGSACVACLLMLLAACGGGSDSGSASGTPTVAAVTLTSLAPESATAGSAAMEITATGTGFTTSSVVEWNGASLVTNYVSASSLTATVPAADLAMAGTASVTVSGGTSGSASSSVLHFTVNTQAAPTISSLAPTSITAGGAAFQLLVTGTHFTSSANVLWNGNAVPTTFDSATQLTAQITAGQIATAATVPVTVVDDAAEGGTSNVSTFTISSVPPVAAPTITTLAPTNTTAGGAAFQLLITGTNFSSSASVLWNGRAVPTTFDSATRLTAQITAAQIAAAASVPVTVFNGASAGGTSNASVFTISAAPPVPTLIALSPSSLPVNAGPVTLTFTGTYFTSTTLLVINNVPFEPTYVSSTKIQFPNFSMNYGAGSQVVFTVQDPASGYVNSNALVLKITPAIPVIASLSPATVTVGQGALSLTVTGQYFTATSVVYFNGTAAPTTLNNQGQLIAQLAATDFAAPGTAKITVEDPASGNVASNSVNLTIQALPPISLTSLSPATVPAGNVAFLLTVHGTGFSSSSAVAWNGTSLATTFVSGTTLRASITAAQVAAVGAVSVTVVNPPNQGGTSSPLTLTIVPPSVDAVSYQIDNGHSGSMTFKTASLPGAASWSYNLGGTASYALIVGQRVYVLALINSNSELFALDATTGAKVWGPIEFSGSAGLTYDGGKLFVNGGAFAAAGVLSALDATTGDTKWSATIPGQFASAYAPVASQGIVFTLEDAQVTAFDESTGAQLWSTNDGSGTNGSLAVTLDGVYTAGPCTPDDLDPTTGAAIWSSNTGCEGGGGATPVVASGYVFSPISPGGYGGNVYAADTGTLLRAFNYSGPPAVSATMIFALTSGTLQGLTLSNNQVDWSFAGDGTLTTSPIVVNNYVFVGSSSGNLYALNATTGAQLWTQSLGAAIAPASQITSGLSAGDGLLVVPAGNSITAYVLSTTP